MTKTIELVNTFNYENEDEYIYEFEKDSMEEVVRNSIESYEKRYKTNVEMFMIGTLGLWDGTKLGGRMVKNINDLLVYGYDDYIVTVEDNKMNFGFNHHDGTHNMTLYVLPTNKFDELDAKDYSELEMIEWIYKNKVLEIEE